MARKIFRFLNYWLSLSTWKHMYRVARLCTEANIGEDKKLGYMYWDKWRWR